MLHIEAADVQRETLLEQTFIIAATVVRLPGLRRQRLLAALTQAELAERAGLQRGTILRLEQGKDCHPTTVRKLATALRCEPRDLIEPKDA